MEGGNIARTPGGGSLEVDDLLVLSTSSKIDKSHFTVFGGTSAAAAQASNIAAQIYAEYPQAWPETVRGLIVHSAKWTVAMKRQFLQDESKNAYRQLLRTCGYGVPELDAALPLFTRPTDSRLSGLASTI